MSGRLEAKSQESAFEQKKAALIRAIKNVSELDSKLSTIVEKIEPDNTQHVEDFYTALKDTNFSTLVKSHQLLSDVYYKHPHLQQLGTKTEEVIALDKAVNNFKKSWLLKIIEDITKIINEEPQEIINNLNKVSVFNELYSKIIKQSDMDISYDDIVKIVKFGCAIQDINIEHHIPIEWLQQQKLESKESFRKAKRFSFELLLITFPQSLKSSDPSTSEVIKPMKSTALELHREIKAAYDEGKITDEDKPKLMILMARASDCIANPGDSEKAGSYQQAFDSLSDSSIGKTPWRKTKIGVAAVGLGLVIAGAVIIGLAAAGIFFSGGISAPFSGLGFKLGWSLIASGFGLAGGAAIFSLQKNAIFKQAEEFKVKADSVPDEKKHRPRH